MSLPQRSLYAGLLVTSLVVTAALVSSGWRLVTQQRELDARETRQEAEAAADALAADVRDALAAQGDRLSARLDDTVSPAHPENGVVVFWSAGGGRVETTTGLPFVPWPTHQTSVTAPFTEAEGAEFTAGSPDVAIRRYRALTRHADPSVRAGALIRLARVLRKRGDIVGALVEADELVALGSQEIDGIPAALAGLDARRLALTQRGDTDDARRAADEIRHRLDAGAWPLDRGTAEFYRDEVSKAPRPDAWALASAVSDVWQSHGGPALPARGLAVLAPSGRPVIVAWRANASSAVLEAGFVDRLLSSVDHERVHWRLTDTDDHHVAGQAGVMAPGSVHRVIGGGASWMLRVWPAPDVAAPNGYREPMLIAATAGTVLFVWAAAALMARALTREAKVAQLQSDFVAAVSHEFRSPLTTMRQMAEMLETDRVPGEARRKQYYGVLAGETARLQRLVERLLDFGRMEAGHAEMRREPLDVAALAQEVVDEMQATALERGGRIEMEQAAPLVRVDGDAQSLRLAIRNLVENAIKYSPETPAVVVRLAVDAGGASIAVSDAGLGIDRDEQAAIFGKFVRGRAAAAGRVRGTGVGLAAVKHVVDAHGGKITLESESGRGSTFTVWLPLAGAAVGTTASVAEGSEA